MAKRFAYRTAIAGITALAIVAPTVAAPQGPVTLATAQAEEVYVDPITGAEQPSEPVEVLDNDTAAQTPVTIMVNGKDLNGQTLAPGVEYKINLQAEPAVKGRFKVPAALADGLNRYVDADDNGKATIKFKPKAGTAYNNWEFTFTPEGGAESEPQAVAFDLQPYNEQFDPQPIAERHEVLVGENVRPHQLVQDFASLPAGTKHAWVGEAPDLNTPGEYEVSIEVTYPDDTKDTVGPITLVVREETTGDVAKAPRLKSENPTIFLGEDVNNEEFIKNLFHRPENLDSALKFAWGTAPDTTKEGEQDVTIVITYPADDVRPEGTQTVPLTVNVVEKNSVTYPAEGVTGDAANIPAGTELKPKDLIANVDKLPERTRFSWVEGKEPKTAARLIGGPLATQKVGVKAAFPDGSEQILEIEITIVEAATGTDKDNNTPRGVNGRNVALNSTLGAPESYITNRTELKNVASYTWEEEPDFTAEGNTVGRILVTYADGTSDIAVARFVVGQPELWRPESFKKGGIALGVSLGAALLLQLPFLKNVNTKIQQQIGIFNPHLAGAADNVMGLLGGLVGLLGLIPSAIFFADGFKVFLPERVAGAPEARPDNITDGSSTPAGQEQPSAGEQNDEQDNDAPADNADADADDNTPAEENAPAENDADDAVDTPEDPQLP